MGYLSSVAVVEHLREGRLEYELGKLEQGKEPPVPVVALRLFDRPEMPGLLYGWSANPNGADDGWRGLVEEFEKSDRASRWRGWPGCARSTSDGGRPEPCKLAEGPSALFPHLQRGGR